MGRMGGFTTVTRLVSQPATALSTLLGGILIDLTGYEPVFALSLGLPVLAGALTVRIRDPRRAPAAATGP